MLIVSSLLGKGSIMIGRMVDFDLPPLDYIYQHIREYESLSFILLKVP